MKLKIFLATIFLPLLPCSALPATERISVATGQILAEGDKPANEAVMTVYHPAKPNGTAILIYPGGGYSVLVVEPEGHRIAKWLGLHGITSAVVEYRLPHGDSCIPLADASRATRIVRSHASDWKLDPRHIGNMGFSAGGHLAATAATHFDKGDPQATNPIGKQSSRPDFSILVYPVITMGENTHLGSKESLLDPSPDPKAVELFSNEKQITADTPPTFLAHALDDTLVVPENSAAYFEALQKNHVPAEYLKLPSGDHGLNNYQGPMWEAYQTACLKWLGKLKFIPAAYAG